MRARDGVLLVAAIAVAAVCVRLGVWQLQRLAERRSYNQTVLAGYHHPVVPLDQLEAPAAARYRRVTVTGRYDHEHEFVLANRPRRGSPGVHLLTPLLRPGNDTAVLVIRGWVYSADGTTVELEPWREDSASGVEGYLRHYAASGGSTDSAMLRPSVLRRLDDQVVAAALPYPLASYLVVLTDTSGAGDGIPPRLEPPALGEGSHLGYAFQWFAFAVIALAGTAVYLLHARRTRAQSTSELQ